MVHVLTDLVADGLAFGSPIDSLRSHLLLFVHQVVGQADIGSVVVDLFLLVYIQLCHIAVHDLVPGFSYGLGSLIVTFTGKFG